MAATSTISPVFDNHISADATDSGALAHKPPKFKASDLPLTPAVRSAIEGLAHTFKKKGGYDAIRKQAWDKFEASVRALLVYGHVSTQDPVGSIWLC